MTVDSSEAETEWIKNKETSDMPTTEPKTDAANATVKKYMLAALVPGLVPLPLIDLAALADPDQDGS